MIANLMVRQRAGNFYQLIRHPYDLLYTYRFLHSNNSISSFGSVSHISTLVSTSGRQASRSRIQKGSYFGTFSIMKKAIKNNASQYDT